MKQKSRGTLMLPGLNVDFEFMFWNQSSMKKDFLGGYQKCARQIRGKNNRARENVFGARLPTVLLKWIKNVLVSRAQLFLPLLRQITRRI